jgi:acyl-CoA thioesterase FadM
VAITIRIRWRDIDTLGHVNNALYLTCLEETEKRTLSELIS